MKSWPSPVSRGRQVPWVCSLMVAVLFGGWSSALMAEAPTEAQVRLLNDLKYLAADEREGRGVGTDGLNQAAEFVRQEFEKAGLDVSAVNGGAFQTFPMVTGAELEKGNSLMLIGPDGQRIELKMDEQFRTCSFGGAGKFSGEIVFLGYAIKDEQYSDFPKDLELKGKVALIMRRNPQQENPHGPFASAHGGVSRHAALTSKLSHAFRSGAAAVLFVDEPYTARNEAKLLQEQIAKVAKQVEESATALEAVNPEDKEQRAAAQKKHQDAERYLKTLKERAKNSDPDALMEFGYGGNGKKNSLPVQHVTKAAANQVLQASLKKSLTELEAAIDEDLKPQTALLKGWRAEGVTSLNLIESEVKNVIGVLEGQGPLADETIVIGAHYDHVGMGGSGSLSPGSKEVHNGADDNASGTAALIELARRLGRKSRALPRRLVFIAFTAEEVGLIGSNHYVKNPVFPLKETIAMFNMDMVGRLREEKLAVFGTGTAKRWKPLVEELGKEHGFQLSLKPEGLGPSDHAKFYGVKIPVLHLFTNSHTDYHRPTDDWDKINVPGMNRVVDFLEALVIDTATTKERPEYLLVKGTATLERGGSRPYFGSIPDFGTEAAGYAVSGAAPESPAANAGMKAGDVIVQMGKQKIGDLNDFDLALRQFKAGDQVDVIVKRDGKDVTLKVILDKPR